MRTIEPITRRESFLAAAGGQSVDLPIPITREEKFLKVIADNSGGGTPSSGYIPIVTNATGEIPKFKADGTLESSELVPANIMDKSDIVVCTQAEYDNMQTKTALLYFIKEEST